MDGIKRHPPWLKVKIPGGKNYNKIKGLVEKFKLHTVCESAECPNVAQCWGCGVATFMILGDTCTRRCGYCSVKTGAPEKPDPTEPKNVALAVKELDLKYVVITSVTRDDLADGGAAMFADTIKEIRALTDCKVEVLVPDFRCNKSSIKKILDARPDVFGHNVEIVRSLFRKVRAQGNYDESLKVFQTSKELSDTPTKSGFMVGLGETEPEIIQTMKDLRAVDCDFLTIGQYLQPTVSHHVVVKYYRPDEFEKFKKIGEELGFLNVESGPLVRSSYGAHKLLKKI